MVCKDSNYTLLKILNTIIVGDELVAKLIPAKQQAFVTFSGLEVFVPEYKVLTGNEFEWVNCSEGKFPPKAVTSGKTSTGENLYVGRY